MSKKNFSSINMGSNKVFDDIEKSTQSKGKKTTASPAEQAARRSSMQTQGRKGCKAVRINMAFTPENHEYIKTMSRIAGVSMTEYTNTVIERYRTEHPEIFEQAKALTEAALK